MPEAPRAGPWRPGGRAPGRRRARRRPRHGVFYGWVVVATLAVVLGIGVGTTFYGTSIYLSALSRGPAGFSLTTVSLATSVFLLVGGLSGLGVARMLERLDARLVIVAGLVTAAAAVLALGHVSTPWQLLVAYSALGTGFSAISVLPASTVLARWFVRRRALAMSITFTGLPVGGALLSPVVAGLVESRGVAGASPWLAAGLVGVAAPLTLLLRPDPASVGSWPDGDRPLDDRPAPPTGTPLAEAVRSGWFLLVTAGLVLGMLSQLGALTHLYNAVSERLDVTRAAIAMSTLTGASLVGRVLGGWAMGRVGLRVATVVLLALQALALVALALVGGLLGVLLAVVAFGITMGNLQVLQPLLYAERFGTRDFARILARGNLLVMVGMAAGPLAVGALHDLTGTYRVALTVIALPALVAALLVAASRRLEPAPRVAPVALPVSSPVPSPVPTVVPPTPGGTLR